MTEVGRDGAGASGGPDGSGLGGPFAPAGAVTGIGSVPLDDPTEAVDAVAAWCPELPFWPQPPSEDLADAALGQVIGSEAAAGVDGPVRGAAAPHFAAFERALRAGAFPRARAVKGQVTGPVTLASLVQVAGANGLDRPEVMAAMAQRVTAQAVWQVQRLRHAGLPVVIFIDEPALGLVDGDQASRALVVLARVFDAVRRAGGVAGIHCCTTSRIGWLAAAEPDVISFDAVHGDVFSDDRPAQRFWSGGGVVAFGLVSVGAAMPSADDLFVRWLAGGMRLRGLAELAQRTVVTSTCGLGTATIDQAADAFAAAAALGALVNRVATADRSAPRLP